MSRRVGLVIVSHSAKLAEGVVELAQQMAPEVRILAAGGLPEDGGLGTDLDTVSAALERADDGEGVVLLYDLGSAQMIAELAVEVLGDPGRAVVVDAPLAEGAVAAAVSAQGGSTLDEVADAAATATAFAIGETVDELFLGANGHDHGHGHAEPSSSGLVELEIELRNEVGLHARPAALLARTVAELDVEASVRFGDQEVSAASVLALMGLGARGGDRITLRAVGPDAQEALARVAALAERGFDE
ncbi:dihydroxyacetone kinase phosphoryl donor subunit DhaM [Crossiella sp. CA-258035]|uniref:dihydroxyacetone kinase phosphoryl donor subunit DhaM n=1 Tax=Crossiella sp. CA-258035 TaxID=2981138 RepID=UPI0024BC60F1|nr:dihydroxyacetone kinase phosphoryl donor subunit DhaM [Crossiella sp. CA-258035]WHT18276.1 dihydroxyacetone kinase phosphoryl donor subunit DhaM [Crossiella sp. CA-258035]